MPRAKPEVVSVTIPITSGASEALDVSDAAVVAILTPTSWTSSLPIVVEGALRSGPNAAFGAVRDSLGQVMQHAADASVLIRLDEREYQHLSQIRFKSDGQGAARTLLVKLVPISQLLEGSV